MEPATAHELRNDAQVILDIEGVMYTDVLDPDPRHDRPVLEVTVGPEYDAVPPRVLRAFADRDRYVWAQDPRPNGVFVCVLF